MPNPPPKPYRTMTPWLGYTPREKKRAKPFARCPSGACRRAKQCIRAVDGLYCRRTHLSPAEARAKAKPGTMPRPVFHYALPKNATLEQVEAYRMMSDMVLASAEAAQARMLGKWKQGVLDHLFGPYDPRGALMQPPLREYRED